MLALGGCGGNGGFKFAKYVNKSPAFMMSFEYIDGWKYLAYKEMNKDYPTVTFFDRWASWPRYISIDAIDVSKAGAIPSTIQTVTENILKSWMEFSEAKVLKGSSIRLLSTRATDTYLSMKMPENMESLRSKMVPVKARIVAVRSGGKYYVLKLVTRQEEFDRYNKAFNRTLRTFRLLRQ